MNEVIEKELSRYEKLLRKCGYSERYIRRTLDEYRRDYIIKERKSKNIRKRIKLKYNKLVMSSVKRNVCCKEAEEILGCTISEFRTYIESKFRKGMAWHNHGPQGWHLDHIVPCRLFDIERYDEIKKCYHYTNLQPLWKEDNFRKASKGVRQLELI